MLHVRGKKATIFGSHQDFAHLIMLKKHFGCLF